MRKMVWLGGVTEITAELLQGLGIRALILDLDNTLTTHDNPGAAQGVPQWLEQMRESGVKLIIVSNNTYARVKPFSDMLGLEFVPDGMKPLSKGVNKAQKQLGVPFSQIAMVGDQVYTDMFAAVFKRLCFIYVEPIEYENTAFFRFKRRTERLFLPKEVKARLKGKHGW